MKQLLKWIRNPKVVGVLICFSVSAAVLFFRFRGSFQFLELKIYDQLLNLQPRDTRAADAIAIVGIDELDVRAMGTSTLTDVTLTKLIDRLHDLGAAAIGLDLFRDQAVGTAQERADLIDAITRNHVYCVEFPSANPLERVSGPIEMYQSRNRIGHIVTCQIPSDEDRESRLAYVGVPMSDRFWSFYSRYAPANVSQQSQMESSLSASLADCFINNRYGQTPAQWRAKDSVRVNVQSLVRFFEPHDAVYVPTSSSSLHDFSIPIDFKGPRVMPEDQAGPGDSVRYSLRQVLATSDNSVFPNWVQTRQELDDYAAQQKERGAVTTELLPINEERNPIRGKIILVGQEAVSIKDFIACPRGDYFRGVEYHALAADYLLRVYQGMAVPRRFLNQSWTSVNKDGSRNRRPLWIGNWREILSVFSWSAIGVIGGSRFNSLPRLLGLFIAAAFVLIGVVYFAFMHNYWISSVIPPAIAFTASASLMLGFLSQHERAERTIVNSLFRRMSGDAVVAEVWAKREEIFDHGRLAPRMATATIMFVDFENFSSRTELLESPERLNQWLFETMQAMTEVTLKAGGTILRYMGDSFFVSFGAPLYRSTEAEFAADALGAIDCALAIRQALAVLNAGWASRGEPTLRIRIGICTGTVAAGTIGTGARLEFTALGDTVNTASRLENCLKDRMGDDVAIGGCRILVSESTHKLCTNWLISRDLGLIDLRKPSLAHVYAVLWRRSARGKSDGGPEAYKPTA
jgi:adenylate cyclase